MQGVEVTRGQHILSACGMPMTHNCPSVLFVALGVKFRSPLFFWRVSYTPATVTQSETESGGYAQRLEIILLYSSICVQFLLANSM